MRFNSYILILILTTFLANSLVLSETNIASPKIDNKNKVIMHNFQIEKAYPLAGYLNINNKTVELIPGLDGVGRAGWILKLKDNNLLIISFEWGVRPRIKAIATNATLLGTHKKELVPVLLEHSGYAKDGKLYPLLKGKILDVEVDIDPKTSWTHVNDSELTTLLAKYAYSFRVSKN
jgi:hypothetical protein